jgi:hypothetical protein
MATLRPAVLAALLLAGCASGTKPWVRPGVDEAKNQHDFDSCRYRAEQVALAGVPANARMPGTPEVFGDHRFGDRPTDYYRMDSAVRDDPLSRAQRDGHGDMLQRRDSAMVYCMTQVGFTLQEPDEKRNKTP